MAQGQRETSAALGHVNLALGVQPLAFSLLLAGGGAYYGRQKDVSRASGNREIWGKRHRA